MDRKVVCGIAGAMGGTLVLPGRALAQCAMCWSTLAHSPEGATLVRGFQSGILFLLLVPFLVVGALAFLIVKERNRYAAGVQPDAGAIATVSNG